MKRCGMCNNRSLKHCKGSEKSCECNCTKYLDTITNRMETDHDSTYDKVYEDINKQWRALHPPLVPKEVKG